MLLPSFDPSKPEAVFRQVAASLAAWIQEGTLKPGERLPSTREMAAALDLHRDTISAAYQDLWSMGLLDMLPRRAPRVRQRQPPVFPSPFPPRPKVQGDPPARPGQEGLLAFTALSPDPRLLPLEDLRSCLAWAMRREGRSLLGYGDPQGFLPLRESICDRMAVHGVHADPGEVLITHGAQQAIDLVFRHLGGPGRTVAVESPTYEPVLSMLSQVGSEALPLPMGPDGLDLEATEAQFRKARPALLYTMPSFHNPTGTSTPPAHRERLLALCASFQVPLLEDAFEEEMKYFGRAARPIKSLDSEGHVIYVGTFSKVLAPGLRTGWLVAPQPLAARLSSLRGLTDLGPPLLLQAAVDRFIRRGLLNLHLARMHRAFRKRMTTLLRALKAEMDPTWATWCDPAGGYLVWLQLHPHVPRNFPWEAHLRRHGVAATLGDSAFVARPEHPCLRLSIAQRDETEILEGIRRLAGALSETCGPEPTRR